ncbi:MAG: NAD-glutamate dehydrogenase, partial [Pseudomonas sp.]
KADFQHQLQAALAQHISEQALPQVAMFAEQFFGIISLDELTQRRMSDLAGCTLSAWRIIERFDPAQPQVHVYNPDYERHGWQSTHTAVEVLHHDLPFLVDSVRTELNRRGYSIHTLQTTVLSVRRGAKGELLEILPKGTHGEGVSQESLMYLEIDRCANAAELNVLTRELEQVLAEVRVAVADFEPMKAKLRDLLTLVEQTAYAPAQAEKAEVKDFLEWLLGNHFTFLGYEEFVVRGDAQGGQLVYDEQSFLGLTRLLRAGLTAEDLRIEDYAVNYLNEPLLLSFAKAAYPSRVHRPAYPDYVSIRQLDADGKVIKECRFMGLYTSSVYGESVRSIPYIRGKVAEVERRSGFDPKAHLG